MITIGKKIYWHVYVYTTDTIPNPDSGVVSGQIGTLDTSTSGDITGSANNNIRAFKSCAFFKTFNLELDSSGDVVDSTAKGVRANDSSIAPGEIIFNLPSSDLIKLFGNPILISNIADIFNPQNRKPLRYALFATYNSADDNCVDKTAPNEWFSFENVPDTVATGDQATQLAAAMSPYLDQSSTGLNTGFFFKIKELLEIQTIGCCDIAPGPGSGSGSSSSSGSGSSSSSGGLPVTDPIRQRSADLDTGYANAWVVRQISDNRISSQRYTGSPLPSELLQGVFSEFSREDIGLNFDIYWKHAGFINFGEQVPKPYSNMHEPLMLQAPLKTSTDKTMALGQMKDPRSGLPIDIQDIFWDARGFLWAYCSGDCTDAGGSLQDGTIDITETTEGIYRLLPGGYAKTSVDIITCGSDGLAPPSPPGLPQDPPTVLDSHSNIFFDPIVGRCSKIACGEDYFTCFIGEDYGDLKFLKAPISNMPDPTSDIKTAGYSGVKDIASGKDHACIIDSNGKLRAWGVNPNNAHIADANASTQLYTKVACGDEITLAIRTDNNIDIWTNDAAELVKTDYFDTDKLKDKLQEYVDDPLNLISSYTYSDIKCKGKMAAIKILFRFNDGTTRSNIALWGKYSKEINPSFLNAGFSADNAVIFLPDSDDSLDFACGYVNYAYIKQDKSLVMVGNNFTTAQRLQAQFDQLYPSNGEFLKIALAFEAGYLIEDPQKKISQFIAGSASPAIRKDLNRNTLEWQDATNSYEIVDCGLNHAAGQTIDGYVYKYNYARLIERSIIDIGTATNKLHKIAKLKDNPVTGEPQSSKYLDGASFYRDATTPSADIDVATMPIYIDSLKTIRNCQWMFKPYKVLGTRVSPGSFETPASLITCMQASGSLIFAPLHYRGGSLGNDGFDYNLPLLPSVQASSKILINESLINVNIVGGSYTITDTDLYFENYNNTPDSIDFGYLSEQESFNREGASAVTPISINRYYDRIESVMNFSDLDINQYSKISIIKSNYYLKNATENLSDKFIGNSASHLTGSNPYKGLINNTKIQRLTADTTSPFATEIKASNTNIPRAEFMASNINRSNYSGGPWRNEAPSLNPFTDYIKGYTLPYFVDGFKQCIPSNNSHTVASKLSFDIQGGGYSEDVYQFSMKWEDHLGATQNDLIADYGTGYAHSGTNSSSTFYMKWDTTDTAPLRALYTSLQNVKWVGDTVSKIIDKMSVMYNKTYGCVLEYGFDSTEVSSGTSGDSKEISGCSKVMSVSDLIVGFWRLSPATHNNKFKLIFDRLEVEYSKSVLNQYGPGSGPDPQYKRYRPISNNKCAHLAGPSQINQDTTYYTTPVRDFTYNKCFIIFEFNVKSGTTTENKKYSFSKFSNFPGYGCTADTGTGSGQVLRKADFLAIDLREALSIEFFPACSINFRPCMEDGTQPFKTSAGAPQYTEMMDHNVGFSYSTQNSSTPGIFYGGLWALETNVDPCRGFLLGSVVSAAFKFYVGIPEAFVDFSSVSVDPASPDNTPVFALIPSALQTNGLSNQSKIISERLIERASKCILLKTHSTNTPFAARTMFITVNRVYNIGDDGLPIILDGESWNDDDYFSKTTKVVALATEPVIIGDGVKIEFTAQNRQQGFVWADGFLYRMQYNGTQKPLVTSIPISYNFNLVKGGVLTNINADAAVRTARNSAHILKTWRSGNLQAHSVGQYLVITNCISTTRTQGSGTSNIYNSDIKNYCVVYKVDITSTGSPSCVLVGMCDLDQINNIQSSFPQNGTDPAPHIGDEDSSNCYSYSSTISADGKDIFVSRHIINNFTQANAEENQKEPVCTETSCFTQVAISTDPKGYKYKANYSTKDVAGNFDNATNLRSNPIISGIASQNRTKIDVIIQGPSTDTLPGGSIDTNSRIVLVGSGYGVDSAGTTGSFFNLLEYNRNEVPPSYKECENLLADPTITPTLNSAFANLNFWASTPISARNGSQSATAFGADVYVTSAGHSICLTPQQNSNNWTIKSISDFSIPTTTVHRFGSSYADLAENLCNDLTSSCPIDEFETFSPPDITSTNSKNTSNIVRALTTITGEDNITQKMIGVAHYLGTTPHTPTFSTKDFTRIYENIPYLKRLNEVEKENNETLKLNPSLRLFVNLFDSFTNPNTPFGINKAIGVATINYFNMMPDFSVGSFCCDNDPACCDGDPKDEFKGYDTTGVQRRFLTNYLGLLGDQGDPFTGFITPPSCSDIIPRFGRDSSDKEGAITSLIQSDVGALIYSEGFQSPVGPLTPQYKERRVVCIRDTSNKPPPFGKDFNFDSIIPDGQFLPSVGPNTSLDMRSDFAWNRTTFGSAELFTINTNNVVTTKYIKNNIFKGNPILGKNILSFELCTTRGGSGSSSSHPDITKRKSNPFGFSLFSGGGAVMSPVGIFIDTTGFTMNHVGNSMNGISKLSINKEYLENPIKFQEIPDLIYDSGSIFTSIIPDPSQSRAPLPTTPLKSFYKYNQLLDMLNCMFDHQYGEVYKDEKISIATMQSLKDVYTGQLGATIVGYNELPTSTSVFLKNCVSITDLKKIRSWMSSRLSVELNKEPSSSLLYGFDADIGNNGGTEINPGPIFDNSIVAQNIKYNNLVFATSAKDLGINSQYWGYSNKIGWVDAVITKLKTTIMSSGYYQIHIIDFKPGRSLSAHTEILKLLAEKSGGTYVPILTDPGN